MQGRTARPVGSVAVVLLAVAGAVLGQGGAAVWPVTGLVVALVAALGARPWPRWVTLAGLAACTPLFAVVCDARSSNVGFLGVCVLSAWAALAVPSARSLVVPLVALLTFAGCAVDEPDPGWGPWVAGTLVSYGASALGRRQRELVAQLEEAQAGLAERTRAEERARVAGEVHDVVGHALTVSLLHISGARLALAEGADDVDDALAEAERLSRRSLEEVRAAVGLVRGHGAAPLPGAAEVHELVGSFRRAGTEVELAVEGDLAGLGATEGLTLYRILQEALTNVVRHADGSGATVRIRVDDGGTSVRVDSAGGGPAVAPPGQGLVGLRERAEALGGHATAGPHGGGWRVEAVLP